MGFDGIDVRWTHLPQSGGIILPGDYHAGDLGVVVSGENPASIPGRYSRWKEGWPNIG